MQTYKLKREVKKQSWLGEGAHWTVGKSKKKKKEEEEEEEEEKKK